ncbi:unnamed protein product [Ilex paraguariensis]|uniref:Uncharacterized protein n=1 Tax=Ilex paraguariensis TaxID=185542 RepID=A0ABC8RUJ5_9AQUA
MARGKIQIRRIENSTNRQVTYSKRRSGLFKKAHELTVLCDAQVSIIMFSCTNKLHEYISPSITTKQFFDQYQRTLGVDLWSSHYEEMQGHLKKLKEVNRNLRREIRQRLGESLNDLNYDDLRGLEQEVDGSVKIIRERKLRNVEEIHRNLLHEFDSRDEDPHYGLVDNGGDYDSVLGFPNGGPHILALRLQPNPPNPHSGGSDLTTYALLE